MNRYNYDSGYDSDNVQEDAHREVHLIHARHPPRNVIQVVDGGILFNEMELEHIRENWIFDPRTFRIRLRNPR